MRAFAAGFLWIGLGSSALAGVVVLENGNVLVGELDPAEVTSEALVVRQPAGAAGVIRVPREKVRWFDVDADAPTADYWRRFPTAPIDAVWEHTRPRPSEGEAEVELPPPPPMTSASRGLRAVPVGDRHVQLRGPEGWSWSRERGVTMWVSDRPGPSGFHPRIHVFSVETPAGAFVDQVGWIQTELKKLADEGGYEVEQLYTLREVAGGADQRMVTSTRAGGQTIAAMRLVSFRANRTYFFAAYAHRDDYERYHRLFQAALRSLELLGESS